MVQRTGRRGSSQGTAPASVPAFVFGEELADLADHDARIVVLTADLARANRAVDFAARHPDRFVNLGIAEKNMITVAAGMGASGHVAYAATFAAPCILPAGAQYPYGLGCVSSNWNKHSAFRLFGSRCSVQSRSERIAPTRVSPSASSATILACPWGSTEPAIIRLRTWG